MRSASVMLSLLICALVLSSCSRGGNLVQGPAPAKPQLRPIPVDKLTPGTYEQQGRAILFRSSRRPTPTEPGTSTN